MYDMKNLQNLKLLEARAPQDRQAFVAAITHGTHLVKG